MYYTHAYWIPLDCVVLTELASRLKSSSQQPGSLFPKVLFNDIFVKHYQLPDGTFIRFPLSFCLCGLTVSLGRRFRGCRIDPDDGTAFTESSREMVVVDTELRVEQFVLGFRVGAL